MRVEGGEDGRRDGGEVDAAEGRRLGERRRELREEGGGLSPEGASVRAVGRAGRPDFELAELARGDPPRDREGGTRRSRDDRLTDGLRRRGGP